MNLYVGNLPWSTSEEELEAALGEGAVRHLRLRRPPAAQPHPVAHGGGALEVGHVVDHAQLLLLREASTRAGRTVVHEKISLCL